MSQDPYQAKLITANPFSKRRQVQGEMVAVMNISLPNRALELIPVPSRVLRGGEIHELILTVEPVSLGNKVNRVDYLGFFEVTQGGVVFRGDQLSVQQAVLGTVLGFDLTHMPNHFNIVSRSSKLRNGDQLGIQLGDSVQLKPPAE